MTVWYGCPIFCLQVVRVKEAPPQRVALWGRGKIGAPLTPASGHARIRSRESVSLSTSSSPRLALIASALELPQVLAAWLGAPT
jgi:hypothetical protein